MLPFWESWRRIGLRTCGSCSVPWCWYWASGLIIRHRMSAHLHWANTGHISAVYNTPSMLLTCVIALQTPLNPLTHTVAIWVQLLSILCKAAICNFWHLGTMTLSPEHQSARMSKITNDSLTRSGTGCFIAVAIWQQWVSRGNAVHGHL